ncbi:MAG: response regulator [Spirochaetales bacterium]|nr:response regulator [Spirochaetales bacterium]
MNHKNQLESGRRYSIVIAEDEPMIRNNIKKKITAVSSAFSIAGETYNGNSALEQIEKTNPDILITDIRMPMKDGLELIQDVYLHYPEVKIIIISGYDDFIYAKTAIQYDVKDYLLKPVNIDELRKTLFRITSQIENQEAEFQREYPVYNSMRAQSELVTGIQEYLRRNFKKSLRFSEVAERFQISQTYLTRIYKKVTGSTPTKYIRDLKVNCAKKLLTERPDLEVKEVSIAVGFEDQGYFSRVFKSVVGCSPQEFREREGLS